MLARASCTVLWRISLGGLLGTLLVIALGCTAAQPSAHAGMKGMGVCGDPFHLAQYVATAREYTWRYLFIAAALVLALLWWTRRWRWPQVRSLIRRPNFRIYQIGWQGPHYLLEAFRRGILHPHIF